MGAEVLLLLPSGNRKRGGLQVVGVEAEKEEDNNTLDIWLRVS